MNEVVESCTSTNDLARQAAEKGAPHGTWISAREQTAGRGRHGRSWLSEKGGLYLSVVLIPPSGFSNLQWIPLAVAVGAARALQDLRIQIKWPNDLWISGRKLGGILCEGSSGAKRWVVAGIGINCENSPTADLVSRPAEKLNCSPDSIREKVRDGILDQVNELFQTGPGSTQSAFERLSVIRPGQSITWIEPKSQHQTSGTWVRLLETAELEVQTSGKTLRLSNEEIISVRAN
ncbi:MAG: biotin--[acetyl-CoA-carboxylase] ligase [Bdellovibrionales bacterium]|nr:biotin--[acetyl-CoA-carboxylase] ligase [Bdellovibrionales bacterium]